MTVAAYSTLNCPGAVSSVSGLRVSRGSMQKGSEMQISKDEVAVAIDR